MDVLPEGEANLVGAWPESRRRGRRRGLEGASLQAHKLTNACGAVSLSIYLSAVARQALAGACSSS